MIEANIHIETMAQLPELVECEIKTITKMYATDLTYDFDFQVYTVTFEEEKWLLANIAMPGLDKILRKAA